jgi:serine/threonine-protein kinase HipA
MKIPKGVPVAVSLEFSAANVLSVGRLAITPTREVLFEYSADFIASGLQINPRLGPPSNELIRPREPRLFRGLHGIFADSLPDAWGDVLVRRLAAKNEVDYSSLTALDRLAIVGHRGMGALVYDPEIDGAPADPIDLDRLADESREVLAGNDSAILEQLEQLGGSPGGARPKVLVAMNADGHVIAGVDVFPDDYEAWMVKFAGPTDPVDIGPLEATYAEMARQAGIDIMPSKLITARNGPGYFATKRFDRGPGGTRVHSATLAALLDVDWSIPTMDYDGVLRAVRFFTRSEAHVLEMFRRMVFNVAAGNRDDHKKQHSFLMDATGRWSLAPAYDLTFSPGPGGQHYLGVGGEGQDISLSHIRKVAENQDIDQVTVASIVDEVLTAVTRFDEIATTIGVSRVTRRAIAPALTTSIRALSRAERR